MNNLRPLLVDQLSFLPAASPVDVGSYIYLVDGTTSKRCTVQNLLDLGPQGAIPTNSVGLVSGAGIATTFLRSDCLLAIDQTIAPTWTGQHIFETGAAGTSPVVFRRTGGTPGTHEVRIGHNGTDALVTVPYGWLKVSHLVDSGIYLERSSNTAYYATIGAGHSGLHFFKVQASHGIEFVPAVASVGGGDSTFTVKVFRRDFELSSSNYTTTNYSVRLRSPRVEGVLQLLTGDAAGHGALICGQPAVGTVGLTVNQITSGTADLFNLNNSVGTAVFAAHHNGTNGVVQSKSGGLQLIGTSGDMYLDVHNGGAVSWLWVRRSDNTARYIRFGCDGIGSIDSYSGLQVMANQGSSLLYLRGTNVVWNNNANSRYGGISCDATSLLTLNGGETGTANATLSSVPLALSVGTDQTDYAPGRFRTLRCNATASFNLYSLVAGVSGEERYIHNAAAVGSGFNITLKHDDGATGTAAMRFSLVGGTDIVLAPQQTQRIWYDATSSRWKV